MRVDRVILRAAVSTLVSILALFAFMLGALCLFFPSTMMGVTYDLGMNAASVDFAKTAFDRSHQIYYVAFATEVAVETGDNARVEECGSLLIEQDGFQEYCTQRDAEIQANISYKQYIYGQVSLAKYALQKTDAVTTAFSGLTENTFPKNNAVVALLVTAIQNGDTQTVTAIQTQMNEMANTLTGEDKAYFEEIMSKLLNG